MDPIPVIGVTKRNFLMISADMKRGRVIVSYKGKVKSALFTDNTLRHLMTGHNYTRNANQFFTATGKLLQQIINENK
jgi:hypothetical protein